MKKIRQIDKKQLALSAAVLAVLLLAGGLLAWAAHAGEAEPARPGGDYVEYEKARVVQVLSDNCESDPVAEGSARGTQSLTAEVLTGQYKGKTLLAENAVGPIYGQAVSEGDRVVLTVSTYENGDVRATVYEYDRSGGVILVVCAFLVLTILVGGRVGAKSLLGLILTVAGLIWVLLPLLLRGWATIPTTFLVCALITGVCFVILGGVRRKTVCAALGTLAGMALATGFGMLAQAILRINGYRQEYAEALLQLRQTGESGVGIAGLVVAGVIISALGAVMDVAMSVSSATQELSEVGEGLSARTLFRRGMNIGRDMVGTMTNTLILAIIGSGAALIVYIYSLGLPVHQFLSSSYLALEVISGVASSVGVILAVPLTAAISALAFGTHEKKAAKA